MTKKEGEYTTVRLPKELMVEIDNILSQSLMGYKSRAEFILSLNYILNFKWNKAKNYYELYLKHSKILTDINQTEETMKLFCEAISSPRKDPLKAKYLSLVLPGAGQVYSGDLRNGLNAFFINGLSAFMLSLIHI